MAFVGMPFEKIVQTPLAAGEVLRLVQVELEYQHAEEGGWVRHEAMDLMFALSPHRPLLGKCGFATQGRLRGADPRTVRANMKLHGSVEVGAGLVARVGGGYCGRGAFRFVQKVPMMLRTAFHWTADDLQIDPQKNLVLWEKCAEDELANPHEQWWHSASHPHLCINVAAVRVWSIKAPLRLTDSGDKSDSVYMWI